MVEIGIVQLLYAKTSSAEHPMFLQILYEKRKPIIMMNSNSIIRTLKFLLTGKISAIAFAILFSTTLNHIWAQGIWTQRADFGGSAREGAVAFSIGTKGYLGTGSFTKDFWEYDSESDTWTQKTDFKDFGRTNASGFSIGSKGYLGTGEDFGATKSFWEYDPAINKWKKKAKFGPTQKGWLQGVGFSIGNKGYLGAGKVGVGLPQKSFWEYDPILNTWTQKADFGGAARMGAVGFSIGDKGYVGTGLDGIASYLQDFWEYDPTLNTWTQKASFEGTGRIGAVGFSLDNKGYLGTGFDGNHYKKDFWEYDPIANAWEQKVSFGGGGRAYGVGFSIGSKGYIGTGLGTSGYYKDFWEYTPDGFNEISEQRNAGIDTSTDKKINPFYESQVNFLPDLSSRTVTAVASQPEIFSRHQFYSVLIYPNPFSNTATISFFLTEDAYIVMEMFDLTGRKLQTILDQNLSAGEQEVIVSREQLSTGLYLLRLKMGEEVMVRKLVVE